MQRLTTRHVLVFVTVALVTTIGLAAWRGGRDPQTVVTPPAATASTSTPAELPDPAPTEPAGDVEPTATAAPTPSVAPTGTGTFAYAPPAGEGIGRRPYRRYSVAVENGLGLDAIDVARFVDETLADERSWIGDGVTGFRRLGPSDQVDFTLVVASPDLVDELCAPLQTNGIYSCGNNGWIALNIDRWNGATEEWPADLETYRRYLVNHEVGHYILGPEHPSCPGPGTPAPIMMQQTIDLGGCAPNGWVYPR